MTGKISVRIQILRQLSLGYNAIAKKYSDIKQRKLQSLKNICKRVDQRVSARLLRESLAVDDYAAQEQLIISKASLICYAHKKINHEQAKIREASPVTWISVKDLYDELPSMTCHCRRFVASQHKSSTQKQSKRDWNAPNDCCVDCQWRHASESFSRTKRCFMSTHWSALRMIECGLLGFRKRLLESFWNSDAKWFNVRSFKSNLNPLKSLDL